MLEHREQPDTARMPARAEATLDLSTSPVVCSSGRSSLLLADVTRAVVSVAANACDGATDHLARHQPRLLPSRII